MRTRDQIVGSILLVLAVVSVGAVLAYAKYREIQLAMSAPPPP